MSISPAHWMPIRETRYSDVHSADDAPSLLSSPHGVPAESHHHRRTSQHHRRTRSRNSRDDGSHNQHQHQHQHQRRHNHAPVSAVRKVALPLPTSHVMEQPEAGAARPSLTLQPRWSQLREGVSDDAETFGSATQSRSSSVSSCLSSSVCSSVDSGTTLGSLDEAHGNTPHVHPGYFAPVLQTSRSSSVVLAELAVKSSGGRWVRDDDDDDDEWAHYAAEERVERPTTPTVSTVSPFPPPPPPLPPATALLPIAATGGEDANTVVGGGGSAQARKPPPRVTANILPPCPALFQHMEGSPHGMQMLSSQSPRLARRKDGQQQSHEQQQQLNQLPLLASPPDNTGAGGGDDGGAGPLGREDGKRVEGSGAVLQSPTGSSNGLSARTAGPTSSPLVAGSNASSLSPTEDANAAAALKHFYPVTPTFSAEGQPTAQQVAFPSASPSPSCQATRHGQLRSPPLPGRGGGTSARTSMATPKSCHDINSLPTSPALPSTKVPPLPRSRFSIPSDSSLGGGGPALMKARPPSLHLTSPRPSSSRRLSSSYMSPLTDYHPSEGSVLLSSLPATPLGPRATSTASTTPLVPPLDFTGISDGPLVRDGETSAGPWWRSSDEASSSMLSPGAAVGGSSFVYSGYDEDDDESEDEFADYRPRWRMEEELRQMEQQPQQQRQSSATASAHRHLQHHRQKGSQRGEDAGDASSSDDYIVPGYNDTATSNGASFSSFNVERRTGTRVGRHPYPSRAAAAYASRAARDDQSRSFWRGGGTHRGAKGGASSMSWTVSVKRFLSVAGTWLTRFLAIYISSLLILKTRNMM